MAERIVRVKLSAQVAEYQQGMMQAAQATRQVGTEGEKLAQQREAFNQVGGAALGMGVAFTAGAAFAVKAASDWESAWAGVTKTVDGSDEQMAQLEEDLRGLTSVLPATHDEIAAVAEAAGQLGIQTENVAAFTQTMINLGETTNLSADEAATALARFSNIMGTSQDQASNLGSALVGLGNNFATTESEISEMALRLAGAGAQVGLTEGDVLGLSAALSSVGIEAEAGGSAFSKVMIDIAASVDEGGERLSQFAEAANMSADDFAAKWRSAPSEALAAFVQGLANAEAQGASTLGVLADLGITEVRMRDALLRSAGAADLFTEAMAQGNDEFEANNALTEEAAKRYETVESRIAIARNAVNDMAIGIGESLLPMVGAAADGVADLAGFVGDLPAPLQASIGVLTALAGVIGVVGGVALLAVPKVVEFRIAMQTLGITGSSVRSRLGSVAGFLGGPWGIAIVAATAGITAFNRAVEEGVPTQSEIANAIQKTASAMDLLNAAGERGSIETFWIGDYQDQLEDLPGLLDHAIRAQDDWATALSTTNAQRGAYDSLKRLGESLGQIAQTDLPAATDAFSKLVDEFDLTDAQASQLLDEMPALRDALLDQATAAGVVADEHDLLEMAMGRSQSASEDAGDAYSDAAGEVQGLEESISDLVDQINEANGVGQDAVTANLNYRDTVAEVDEYIRNAKDGVEGYTATLDTSTEAGRENMRMLVGMAEDSQAAAQAQYELDGDTKAFHDSLRNGRAALIKRAEDLGYTREEAEKLADKIYEIPTERTTTVAVNNTDRAIRAADAVKRALSGIQDTYTAQVVIQTSGTNTITGQYQGGFWQGGVQAFASGGFPSGVYQGRQGGIHKFAESEMGVPWETYISGRPADRERNVGIWMETGRRLGALESSPASVSLDGASITGTLEIGGDGLARIIDGRISVAGARDSRVNRGRLQTI